MLWRRKRAEGISFFNYQIHTIYIRLRRRSELESVVKVVGIEVEVEEESCLLITAWELEVPLKGNLEVEVKKLVTLPRSEVSTLDSTIC